MENSHLPLVSIVSVNWNQVALTAKMIASLQAVSYPNIEILIVDNGSTKGNPQELKTQFPDIKLVISQENLGFAGGNNLAFPMAQGKYVLLLNNDTEVDPDFLAPMVELMEENPGIGIVSPKIFFFDKENTLQYAGTTAINSITMRGKKFGYGEKDTGLYEEVAETGYANGACMLVRTKVLEEVGYLYEDYFLYYEEHDFCERVRQAGYSIFFQPASRIYHKVSASTGKLSPLKTYYQHRNRLLFHRRNIKGMPFWLGAIYYFLVASPKKLLSELLSGRINNVVALIRAVVWHVLHPKLPKV